MDTSHDRISVQWLIKGLALGGAEQLLLWTVRAADRERFEFRVAYVLGHYDQLVPALLAEGVAVTSLGARRTLDPRWVLALRRHLVRTKPDLIHVHSPLVAAVTRLIARTLANRPPIVTTEHNTWPAYRSLTRLANRLTFRLDDAHIAVSEAVVRSMPRAFQEMTEVVVQGIEVESVPTLRSERDQVRRELGIGPEQIAICAVANLKRHKGYPDLMAAARVVIDQGCDVVFLAVGEGPLEAEVRARHAELRLGERFRLLGYRADATRILAGSDIFVMASVQEGYPIALMEALAAGLPVVATDAGEAPNAVHSGVEGFIVPRGDSAALAESLTKLARDADLRASMATAAAARGPDFDISKAVRRTMEIYRALIATRTARQKARP